MKCLCLVMSSQHYGIAQLAEYFGVSRHTIYNWFTAWESEGLGGLYRQPGQGRKSTVEAPIQAGPLASPFPPTAKITQAALFSEANAVFSGGVNRPDIPLFVRQQRYGAQQTEFVSTWRLGRADYLNVVKTGRLYLRLLGPLPYKGLTYLSFWDAKPVDFANQTLGVGNDRFLGIPARYEPYTLDGNQVLSTYSV